MTRNEKIKAQRITGTWKTVGSGERAHTVVIRQGEKAAKNVVTTIKHSRRTDEARDQADHLRAGFGPARQLNNWRFAFIANAYLPLDRLTSELAPLAFEYSAPIPLNDPVEPDPAPTPEGGDVTIIPGPDGAPAFAAVPWATWTALMTELEELTDAAAADAAARDETFPKSVVDQMVAGDHPIKVFRKYRGLTQKALADLVDTSPVYLSQIERGERTGGMDLLKKLATALDVTLDDIT